MEVDQILKRMALLSVGNFYVGLIRLESYQLEMDAKEATDKSYFINNHFKIFVGYPIICKKSMTKIKLMN